MEKRLAKEIELRLGNAVRKTHEAALIFKQAGEKYHAEVLDGVVTTLQAMRVAAITLEDKEDKTK